MQEWQLELPLSSRHYVPQLLIVGSYIGETLCSKTLVFRTNNYKIMYQWRAE